MINQPNNSSQFLYFLYSMSSPTPSQWQFSTSPDYLLKSRTVSENNKDLSLDFFFLKKKTHPRNQKFENLGRRSFLLSFSVWLFPRINVSCINEAPSKRIWGGEAPSKGIWRIFPWKYGGNEEKDKEEEKEFRSAIGFQRRKKNQILEVGF